MLCTKGPECNGKVEFEVAGGLCLHHYVDWLLEEEKLSEQEYAKLYKETLSEVQLHMRLTDAMVELNALIDSDDFKKHFADEDWVDTLELAMYHYHKHYCSHDDQKD